NPFEPGVIASMTGWRSERRWRHAGTGAGPCAAFGNQEQNHRTGERAMIHDHSKWGPTDQIGAGNLLTAEKRLEALASVKQGRVYDVSHEIAMGAPALVPNQPPYLMSMFVTWKHAITRRRKLGATNDAGANLERIEMTTHVGTHIDALGHFS